ncbi:MAG: hypothetical protein IV090_18665 [Candidatus Sericytochromatia bacterium]|nr:hypothetical protein [Candidatus Sericytochromatia bacterium]
MQSVQTGNKPLIPAPLSPAQATARDGSVQAAGGSAQMIEESPVLSGAQGPALNEPKIRALSGVEAQTLQEPKRLNDSLTIKMAVNAEQNKALVQVQSQLTQVFGPAEFDRLFAGQKQNIQDVQTVLNRRPDLLARIQSLPHGSDTLALFKTASVRPLKEAEVLQLQHFLVESTGAKIGYKGHPSGLDGDYGNRTHGALIHFLRSQISAAPQPTATHPAHSAPPPTLPSQTPLASPAELSPERLHQLLKGPQQSLKTVAKVVMQLPQTSRDRIAATPEGAAFLASLEKADKTLPSKAEIQTIQAFLVKQGASLRYPGHPTGIDGQYGSKTFQALRTFLAQSLQSPSQTSPADGPYPRYDRMVEDGLLDMTVALGYDEGAPGYAPSHHSEEIRLTAEIQSRGFVRNDAKALELLKKAGKEVNGSYSAFYLKENIATANGQPVHSILRVITSGDGQAGAQKRKTALEGMNQSDVFMYGGHARFGTGPDFDSNLAVTIDWEGVPNPKGQGKVTYHDETALKELLSPSGNDSQALDALKGLQKMGKVTIQGQNEGNLRIGSENKHPYEFGSYLMNEALKDTSTQSLAEEISGDKYRLWLFNGCRTQDYQTPIRTMGQKNSALSSENLDLFMTNQTLWWENTAGSLMAFLDGVSAFEKASDISDRLQKANPDQGRNGKTHLRQGFDDNPLHVPYRPE